MPNESEFQAAMPRKVMTLFLLVDCSGSMCANGNIDKVNSAIEEMRDTLKDVSEDNPDAEIKIAILKFSSGTSWVGGGVQSLDNFVFNRLEADGVTDMGEAFAELDRKLSRNAFMDSKTGAYAPVLILLSDGYPTDDWEAGLKKLQSNNWYKSATKIAIYVDGDDGGLPVMSSFARTPEAVLQVNGQKDTLKKLLTRMAVVSSTMQSRSSTHVEGSNEDIAKETAVQAVQSVLAEDDTDDVHQLQASDPADALWDDNW